MINIDEHQRLASKKKKTEIEQFWLLCLLRYRISTYHYEVRLSFIELCVDIITEFVKWRPRTKVLLLRVLETELCLAFLVLLRLLLWFSLRRCLREHALTLKMFCFVTPVRLRYKPHTSCKIATNIEMHSRPSSEQPLPPPERRLARLSAGQKRHRCLLRKN